MNKLTKAVMLLSSAALMVGLSACGGSSPQPQAPVPATAEAPAPTFNKFTANTEEQNPSLLKGYSTDEVTMPDGLVVRCLRYYGGGSMSTVIECNWYGAHR